MKKLFTFLFLTVAVSLAADEVTDYYTVEEVMSIYADLNLSSGETSTDVYTVRGYVTKWNSGYPQYQNADFFIDDASDGSTSLLKCFRLNATEENDKRPLDVGDYVEASGNLMNYNGQAEIKNGTFRVITAVETPAEIKYTLTLIAGEGGSVSCSPEGPYDEGTEVIITATEDEGYTFTQWSDGNTDNPRTITMWQDVTLSAEFEPTIACVFAELDGKSGKQIRVALHDMIADHTVLSYYAAWANNTGADYRENGNIWDMYSNCQFDGSDKCGSGTSSEDCECYNREHSLPKSWWGHNDASPEPMYTDLHHLIPTDRFANSQRSAWPLGEVSSTEWTNGSSRLGYGTFGSDYKNKTFEPADEYKGDFARIYFYMATCYMDKNFTQGGKGYKVFASGTAEFTYAARELYLKWHREDPVSQKEIDRNNAVEILQGNRNPFVDEPDLAEYIWGNMQTKTYHCGQSEEIPTTFTVTFKDWNGTILKTQQLLEGQSATPPEDPYREGYTFIGWDKDYSDVHSDLTITAQYSEGEKTYYKVRFFDWDDTLLKQQNVERGKDATPPEAPYHEGYKFIGWDQDYTNVTRNLIIYAMYKKSDEALDTPSVADMPIKLFRDGQLYIMYEGKMYNVLGMEVK